MQNIEVNTHENHKSNEEIILEKEPNNIKTKAQELALAEKLNINEGIEFHLQIK